MMPRKSGIDALRELRAAGIDTPALIVSAHTDGGDGEDHAGLAISGYIAKPIDFDQLFSEDRRADRARSRHLNGTGLSDEAR